MRNNPNTALSYRGQLETYEGSIEITFWYLSEPKVTLLKPAIRIEHLKTYKQLYNITSHLF